MGGGSQVRVGSFERKISKKTVDRSEYLSGVLNVTDKGVDVWGMGNEGTNTSKTQVPARASSDTSRPSSCILRG